MVSSQIPPLRSGHAAGELPCPDRHAFVERTRPIIWHAAAWETSELFSGTTVDQLGTRSNNEVDLEAAKWSRQDRAGETMSEGKKAVPVA